MKFTRKTAAGACIRSSCQDTEEAWNHLTEMFTKIGSATFTPGQWPFETQMRFNHPTEGAVYKRISGNRGVAYCHILKWDPPQNLRFELIWTDERPDDRATFDHDILYEDKRRSKDIVDFKIERKDGQIFVWVTYQDNARITLFDLLIRRVWKAERILEYVLDHS